MSKTNDKREHCKQPGDAGDIAIGASVAGGLGLIVGFLVAGPIGAIALGSIYAGTGAIVAATGHEMDASDLS
jgi:uncharacterized membrane protein